MLAPTSFRSRPESGDVLVSYNPHLLVRQFGLDQGAVVEMGNVCISVRKVKDQYTRASMDSLFGRYASVYWPSLLRRGV